MELKEIFLRVGVFLSTDYTDLSPDAARDGRDAQPPLISLLNAALPKQFGIPVLTEAGNNLSVD